MLCHTPFLFFEILAHIMISIVGFVVQVKGLLRAKMERNKLKSSQKCQINVFRFLPHCLR